MGYAQKSINDMKAEGLIENELISRDERWIREGNGGEYNQNKYILYEMLKNKFKILFKANFENIPLSDKKE